MTFFGSKGVDNIMSEAVTRYSIVVPSGTNTNNAKAMFEATVSAIVKVPNPNSADMNGMLNSNFTSTRFAYIKHKYKHNKSNALFFPLAV